MTSSVFWGFNITFSPPESFIGYPKLYYGVIGTYSSAQYSKSMNLDELSMSYAITGCRETYKDQKQFSGFKLQHSEDETITVSLNCEDEIIYSMQNKRLIGFRVIKGPQEDPAYISIRSVAPIIDDNPGCTAAAEVVTSARILYKLGQGFASTGTFSL